MDDYSITVMNESGILSLEIKFTGSCICEVKQGSDQTTKEQIAETCKSFVDQARRSMIKLHSDQVTELQNNREFKNNILIFF